MIYQVKIDLKKKLNSLIVFKLFYKYIYYIRAYLCAYTYIYKIFNIIFINNNNNKSDKIFYYFIIIIHKSIFNYYETIFSKLL